MQKSTDLKYVIIIPARYQSNRLPGKPLIDICGQSMVKRTYERCCMAMNKSSVFVATDDVRIFEHCKKNDINVIMTPDTCKTGTDRVFEASKLIDADVYINVQGDEPIINPNDIKLVIQASKKNPNMIINAMCAIDEIDFNNPNIPKVVTSLDNRLLYSSRIGIPSTKSLSFIKANKQVCIYAFPKKALVNFSNFDQKTPLEELEDIEILRFIEIGYDVRMVEVSNTSFSVDVPEDVKKVEFFLNA